MIDIRKFDSLGHATMAGSTPTTISRSRIITTPIA